MSPSPRRKFRLIPWFIGTGFIVVLLIIYVVAMFLAPMPTIRATTVPLTVVVPARAAIAWPSSGQAAVGVYGQGVLLTNGEQKSVPIASVAKLVLALALLKKQPMQLNQPGGTITFTEADEQMYRDKIEENQSVVPIKVGEQLTQYQALQALLLPSGNNIADTLAIWAFGSVSNYLAVANQQLADWGLTQTHLDDASGFSPLTVSSAHDLVLLGEKVLAEPVLAEIVQQKEVTLPVAGLERNVNTLLGTSNIIGIKTGNTDEAGGCFLFAAKNVGEGPAIIGAFLGLPKLADALAATTSLLKASAGNFAPIAIAPAGSTIATYEVPWAKPITVITKSAATIISPTNDPVATSVTVPDLTSPTSTTTSVGTLHATVGALTSDTPLVLSSPLQRPLFRWRLMHPIIEIRALMNR
jgi:D-alanyl-D-alanine carboxypeptidase (penicillin-binding protein 5/6)